MSAEQFPLNFLAPVPVGHRVQLDFHLHQVGFVGSKLELNRKAPRVVDLDSGIVYGTPEHFGRDGFDPTKQKPTVERVVGVVKGCWVVDRTGSDGHSTFTMLAVSVSSRGAPRD